MTAWSSFWGLSVGAYAIQNNRPSTDRKIGRFFRSQTQRVHKALAGGLIGAASGSNVTDTRNRIVAVQTIGSIDNLGGKRAIETVTLINRNTTAADVSALKAITGVGTAYPASYPADKSGNAGGGKLGF